MSRHLNSRRLVACIATALLTHLTTACSGSGDLQAAVTADGTRRITAPTTRIEPWTWQEIVLSVDSGHGSAQPVSSCWLGDNLIVADGASAQLSGYSNSGDRVSHFRITGTLAGKFRSLAAVRCAWNGAHLLVVDETSTKISFFDSSGNWINTVKAPRAPNTGLFIAGEYAISSDSTWFDSWLSGRLGPYLEDDTWSQVYLVRSWNNNGERIREFGAPSKYQDKTLRRVFNAVDFAMARDTLWVLQRANARLQGFRLDGQPVGEILLLPVYHMGREPHIELGPATTGTFLRQNRAVYHPNVDGLVILSDSLFATIRRTDWTERESSGATSLNSTNSIEIFNRHGAVVTRIDVPSSENVRSLSSDGRSHLAVIYVDAADKRHIAVTKWPR